MEPQGFTPNVGEDLIGSATTAGEVIAALARRGCSDLTLSIDLGACSDLPRGGGGFCDIYRGALRGGFRIAIKSLRIYEGSEADGDSERRKILKRAARELYHWSKLQHRNVLPLLGLATFRGQISMISEWMDNGNLVSFLRLNPSADRNRLCMEVCEGLCHIHMSGMVHGDLKAANVVVSPRGTAMIADFGNAQLNDLTLKFTSITKSGFSVRWAAPELLLTDNGPQVSKEADVYAYGMTVLEALTGKMPYEGVNDHRILILVAVEKKVPPRPDVSMSDGLWDLLNSCWTREPTERPEITSVRDRLQTLFWPSSDTGSIEDFASHFTSPLSEHKPEAPSIVSDGHELSVPSFGLISATPDTLPNQPEFELIEILRQQMGERRVDSPLLSGSQPSKGSGSQVPPRLPALVMPGDVGVSGSDASASLFEASQPGLFPPPSLGLIPATPVTPPTNQPKFGFQEILRQQMAQRRAASPLLSASQAPLRPPALVIPSDAGVSGFDASVSLFEASQPGLVPPPSLGLIPATPVTPPTNQPELGFQEILRQQVAQRRAASPLLSSSQPSDNSGSQVQSLPTAPDTSLQQTSCSTLVPLPRRPPAPGPAFDRRGSPNLDRAWQLPTPELDLMYESDFLEADVYKPELDHSPLSSTGQPSPYLTNAEDFLGNGLFAASAPAYFVQPPTRNNTILSPPLDSLSAFRYQFPKGASPESSASDDHLSDHDLLFGYRQRTYPRARAPSPEEFRTLQSVGSSSTSGSDQSPYFRYRTQSDTPATTIDSSLAPDPVEGGVGPRRHSGNGSHRTSPSHKLSYTPRTSPGSDNAGNQLTKPAEQQVVTPDTGEASSSRRTAQVNFKCPVPGCGSTFTHHSDLRGHIRSHNEDRPFKCKWPGCDKGFARQHDCKRHEALHLNIRPYTCEGCQKTFARNDALIRHLRSEGGIECRKVHSETTGTFLPDAGAGVDWETSSGNVLV